ncbi:hypothetical protein BT96DRAFT_947999 [Gymnopus androsaceus JB14]|uniref:Uncharacterized protein n=1 Tax=Gymnopus androsaceus JB14 TaxID=1447944 RepID=A0A6A4GRV3_9AGAR|nr:hypothetical protein BT96DRAFT_947999 [Gymnopus androsaceus JB14]
MCQQEVTTSTEGLAGKGGHDSGSRFTWTCDAGNRRAKLATCDRFQTRGKPVNRYRNLPQILAPLLVLNSKTATIGKVLVLLVPNQDQYILRTFVPTGLPVPAGHNKNKNGDLQPGITRGKPVPGPAGTSKHQSPQMHKALKNQSIRGIKNPSKLDLPEDWAQYFQIYPTQTPTGVKHDQDDHAFIHNIWGWLLGKSYKTPSFVLKTE